MRALILALLTVMSLVCVACSADEQQTDVARYWTTFRQAVLDNDKQKIASLTRFPFEVRGPDDSDPVKSYDREGFLAIYERLVVQKELLPSDGKLVAKSMRQLIAEASGPLPEQGVDSNSFQFHQFEFERVNGRWLFTRAYLEE